MLLFFNQIKEILDEFLPKLKPRLFQKADHCDEDAVCIHDNLDDHLTDTSSDSLLVHSLNVEPT